MSQKLQAKLAASGDCRIRIVDEDLPSEVGAAPIIVKFENGTRLRATYWRLIKRDKAVRSSFDDRQTYGLPAPVDARADLRTELDDRHCTTVRLHPVTGDLVLDFAEGLRLQVFNFTAYEIWEVTFADGSGEYSNYALAAD